MSAASKKKNLFPELAKVFKGHYQVLPPRKTKGRPSVDLVKVRDGFLVTFTLKHLVRGQTFLGLYPTAANLPNADNLKVGDYALLGSGEILQIGK
jgi:hypothetical protein